MSITKIRAVLPPNCIVFWLELPTSATRDQLLFRSPTADSACDVDYGSQGKLSKLGGSSDCQDKITFKVSKLYLKNAKPITYCITVVLQK